jgi:hypothetical protein
MPTAPGWNKGKKRCKQCDKWFSKEDIIIVDVEGTKNGRPIKRYSKPMCKACKEDFWRVMEPSKVLKP